MIYGTPYPYTVMLPVAAVPSGVVREKYIIWLATPTGSFPYWLPAIEAPAFAHEPPATSALT